MMPIQFNEEDARKFYRFFKHNNKTEVIVFDKIKYPHGKTFFISDEEEFIRTVKHLNVEEKVDVYIGGRDRTGTGDANVVSSFFIFLEIDEHDVEKPQEIITLEKLFRENVVKYSLKIFSGGGYHYYVQHKFGKFDDDGDKDEYRHLLQAFRETLLQHNIDIDKKVFDLQRVSRIAGTYNHKRAKLSKIIELNELTETEAEVNASNIKELVNNYSRKTITTDLNVLAILEIYNFDKHDVWLHEIFKKNINFDKEDTGRNSVLFKNVAIICCREGMTEEEISAIGKALAGLCPGRTYAMFDSWVRKIKKNEIGAFHEVEINRWIEKHNHPLTKYSPKIREATQINDSNGSNDGNGSNALILHFRAEHLPYFKDFWEISCLEGKEYAPILKGVYYHVLSRIVTTHVEKVKLGQLQTDLRVHILIPLSSGQGKKNIKQLIIKLFEKLNYKGHVPTSLNPEQLIGKVINRGTIKKPNWLPNHGYFSRDFLIFDEMHTLLSSKDLNITESRKNLRIAKDPIGENLVEKKLVENTFDSEERLAYCPKVVVCGFTQPKSLNAEIAEEGDLRRDLILHVSGLSARDKTEDYSNRLNKNSSSDEGIKLFSGFCENVKQTLAGKQFVFTDEAVTRIIELHKELVAQGFTHSEKGRNFTKMIDFTLQDLLVKLSCILVIVHGKIEVTKDIIELAYMDIAEFFQLQLDFVKLKVLGNLDYGEGWQGSQGKDQECLNWLFQQGANSEESSKITVREFKLKIATIKNTKEDMAEKHYQRFKKNGWIDFKQSFQDSRVWLAFIPQKIHGGNAFNDSNAYETIISRYESIRKGLLPLPSLLPLAEDVVKDDDERDNFQKESLETSSSPVKKSITDFSLLDNDRNGKCSYCGFDERWIRWKDNEGNHLCENCHSQELNNV